MKNPACLASIAVFFVSFLAPTPVEAVGAGSNNDHEIELSEVKLALSVGEAEKARLQQKLVESDEAYNRLQSALAAAKSESEVARRRAAELELRIESLGVSVAGGNLSKLEQRLLAAVSDLKLANDDRKVLREALVALIEAVNVSRKITPSDNAEAKVAVEVGLRGAKKALGIHSDELDVPAAIPSTMIDGMVISMKDDLSLVVANIGASQGVRVGMPFLVTRGEKTIGSVRVVDVREKIAGAVIQNSSKDSMKIEVGDRLTVMTQKPQ